MCLNGLEQDTVDALVHGALGAWNPVITVGIHTGVKTGAYSERPCIFVICAPLSHLSQKLLTLLRDLVIVYFAVA